jgi:hypothetical protein
MLKITRSRLVYIRENCECCISQVTQDLPFIFHVPIKNTILKNSEDEKGHKISSEPVFMILTDETAEIPVIICQLFLST